MENGETMFIHVYHAGGPPRPRELNESSNAGNSNNDYEEIYADEEACCPPQPQVPSSKIGPVVVQIQRNSIQRSKPGIYYIAGRHGETYDLSGERATHDEHLPKSKISIWWTHYTKVIVATSLLLILLIVGVAVGLLYKPSNKGNI